MAASPPPRTGSAVATTAPRMRPPWRTTAGVRAGHGFLTPPAVKSRARARWHAQSCTTPPRSAGQALPRDRCGVHPTRPPAPGGRRRLGRSQRVVACARHPRAPPSGSRRCHPPLPHYARRVGDGLGGWGWVGRSGGWREVDRSGGAGCAPSRWGWGGCARVSIGLAAAPPLAAHDGGRGPLRCGAGLWSLSWCCGQGRRQGTCALAVMKGNAPRRAAPANHAPTHRGAPRRQAQLLYRRLSRRLPDGLSCGLCHWRRP